VQSPSQKWSFGFSERLPLRYFVVIKLPAGIEIENVYAQFLQYKSVDLRGIF